MKLDISKLSEDRELELSEEWDALAFDLNSPGWQYAGPLKVQIKAVKDSGIAKIKASVQAPLELMCSRCSKTFSHVLNETFDLVYALDLSDRVIEIDEGIREELLLNYPTKILCQENCKGLCLKCGADLNEEKCKCQTRT
jgi:uncharacterized protein